MTAIRRRSGRAAASRAVAVSIMVAVAMPHAVFGVRSQFVRPSVLDHSLAHGSGAPAAASQTVVSGAARVQLPAQLRFRPRRGSVAAV